jgi:hypothetical protein
VVGGPPQGLRDAAERAGRARPPVGRSGLPEGPNRTYGGGACPPSMPIGPHIARRAAPTRRAAPPHEMGVYLRRLVLFAKPVISQPFCFRPVGGRGPPTRPFLLAHRRPTNDLFRARVR